MKCDCWIGILNDYDQSALNNLHLSEIYDRLSNRSEHSKRMAEILNRDSFEPWDYIDNRRGLATLFNYCPSCGLKINWNGLRKNVRKEYTKLQCTGMNENGNHTCCERAGEYNGFASGPSFFDCPENCPCHD